MKSVKMININLSKNAPVLNWFVSTAVIYSLLITRGKGIFGSGRSKNWHNGPQPSFGLYINSLSSGTKLTAREFQSLKASLSSLSVAVANLYPSILANRTSWRLSRLKVLDSQWASRRPIVGRWSISGESMVALQLASQSFGSQTVRITWIKNYALGYWFLVCQK